MILCCKVYKAEKIAVPEQDSDDFFITDFLIS